MAALATTRLYRLPILVAATVLSVLYAGDLPSSAAVGQTSVAPTALPTECVTGPDFVVHCTYTAGFSGTLTLPSGASDLGIVAVGGTGGGTGGGKGASATALHGQTFGQTLTIEVGQNGGSGQGAGGGGAPGAPNTSGGGGGGSAVTGPLQGTVDQMIVAAGGGGGASSGGVAGGNAGAPGASAGGAGGGGGGGVSSFVFGSGLPFGGTGGSAGTVNPANCDNVANGTAGSAGSIVYGSGPGGNGGTGGAIPPNSAGGGGGGGGGLVGGGGGGGGGLCGALDIHGIFHWTRHPGGGGAGGTSYIQPTTPFFGSTSILDGAAAPGGTPQVVISFQVAHDGCSAPDAGGHVACQFRIPGSYAVPLPATATDVSVEAAGAQGGGAPASSNAGGMGAVVSASFGSSPAGRTLTVKVGGAGGPVGAGAGGFPDGGSGGSAAGGGGGGASSITGLVVAGGGGGEGVPANLLSPVGGTGGNAGANGADGDDGGAPGVAGSGGHAGVPGLAGAGGSGGSADFGSCVAGGSGHTGLPVGDGTGGATISGQAGGGGGGGATGGGGGGAGVTSCALSGNVGGGGGGGGSSLVDPSATTSSIADGASAPNLGDGWVTVRYTIGKPKTLIKNGSFEKPDLRGQNQTLNAGSTFGPWLVTAGSVDAVDGSYWPAADGTQSIDLAGLAPGAISQTLQVPVGGSFKIRFALAGNPECGKANKKLAILWDGAQVATKTFDTTGHTVADLGWISRTVTVVATAGTHTVGFAGLTAGSCGPALDNVSVKLAP